jgi:hypothetical protein
MNLQPREDRVTEGFGPRAWREHVRGDPAALELGPRIMRQFSHRCRNSLSGIKLGLYLLKKELQDPSRSGWNDLGRRCDEIEKLFDRLDRIYQSTSLTLVRSPLGQLFAERLPMWRSRYPDWGHTIRLEPPEQDLAGDFDPSHLGLGLDAFVMWRAESGDSREPRLAWRTSEGQFQVSWQETPNRAENNHARRSPESPPGCQPGDCTASLALLLLARVTADHGGEFENRNEPTLNMMIRWPQFSSERLKR